MNSLHCPRCRSKTLQDHSNYETQNNGSRKLHQCLECRQIFSETKGTFLERLRKPISFILYVLKSRSEGMGFNAACRTFEISKHTLLDWEQRFAGLKGPWLIYSLLPGTRSDPHLRQGSQRATGAPISDRCGDVTPR